jgi:hypothetical protein
VAALGYYDIYNTAGSISLGALVGLKGPKFSLKPLKLELHIFFRLFPVGRVAGAGWFRMGFSFRILVFYGH